MPRQPLRGHGGDGSPLGGGGFRLVVDQVPKSSSRDQHPVQGVQCSGHAPHRPEAPYRLGPPQVHQCQGRAGQQGAVRHVAGLAIGREARGCPTPPLPLTGRPRTLPHRFKSSDAPRSTSNFSSPTTLARSGTTHPIRAGPGSRSPVVLRQATARPSAAGPTTWYARRAAPPPTTHGSQWNTSYPSRSRSRSTRLPPQGALRPSRSGPGVGGGCCWPTGAGLSRPVLVAEGWQLGHFDGGIDAAGTPLLPQ